VLIDRNLGIFCNRFLSQLIKFSMPKTIAEKLRIKEGNVICTIHAPAEFAHTVGKLPKNARIITGKESCDQVHWFVKNKKQLDQELTTVLSSKNADTVYWIYFPKGSSKVQTDLSRDHGWGELLNHNYEMASLISFDHTWSAVRLQPKSAKTSKKPAAAAEILKYVDATKRIVHLPEDFEAVMKKHPKEKSWFEQLSFTNKKEYVEWIVSAKKKETRLVRIHQSIERLGMQWKNPSNR
jgi:hypothetical protein